MTWRVATYPSRFFRTLWSLRALSLAQRTAAARSTAPSASAALTTAARASGGLNVSRSLDSHAIAPTLGYSILVQSKT